MKKIRRADFVGSFLRPTRLKEVKKLFDEGLVGYELVQQVTKEEIAKLVEKQREAGLDIFTDGEFHRRYWHFDFFWGLNNVIEINGDSYKFAGKTTNGNTTRIIGKINGKNHEFVSHFKFLASLLKEGEEARITIPSPSQFLGDCFRSENVDATNLWYPNVDDLIEDVVAAYLDVCNELYLNGCRNIQFDDCTWTRFVDEDFVNNLDLSLNKVENVEELKQRYLKVNNLLLEKLPSDILVTTHVCRGNFRSTWLRTGGYEKVADLLFNKSKYNGLYLEFDNERSGGFEPLKHVSDDKFVVLGLITSKDGTLEDEETIINRIKQASEFVKLENLCLSTQCGFASTIEGNEISEEQQWNKIKLVMDVAKKVWG